MRPPPASPFAAHPHDDLAVHALDALDGPARWALGHHLAGCPGCRSELDELRATAARLVRPVAPPPRVWALISTNLPAADGSSPAVGGHDLAGARGGAGAGEPVSLPGRRHHDRHPGSRRGWRRPAIVLAAAAAIAVVAGAAGFVSGRAGDGSPPSGVVALADAALADPGNPRVALTDGSGREVARVVVEHGDGSDGDGYVVLDALDRLPEGRTYQLWRFDGPTPVSLGVLGDGTTGALAVPLPAGLLDDPATLAITAETAPGVAAPTGPIVAEGVLPAPA